MKQPFILSFVFLCVLCLFTSKTIATTKSKNYLFYQFTLKGKILPAITVQQGKYSFQKAQEISQQTLPYIYQIELPFLSSITDEKSLLEALDTTQNKTIKLNTLYDTVHAAKKTTGCVNIANLQTTKNGGIKKITVEDLTLTGSKSITLDNNIIPVTDLTFDVEYGSCDDNLDQITYRPANKKGELDLSNISSITKIPKKTKASIFYKITPNGLNQLTIKKINTTFTGNKSFSGTLELTINI